MFEQLLASVFKHVGHELKAFIAAIVGIGNIGNLMVSVFAEAGKQGDFLRALS